MRGLPLQTHQPIPAPRLGTAHARLANALAAVEAVSKTQAYQAWLGYYNSSTKALRWDKETLVARANDYVQQVLRGEVPELEAKTVGKMGLRGTRGLRVASGPSGQSARGRGGGPPGRSGQAIRDGGAAGGGHAGRGGGAGGVGPGRGGTTFARGRGGARNKRPRPASGTATPL